MSALIFILISIFFSVGDEIVNGDDSVVRSKFNSMEIRDEPQQEESGPQGRNRS